MARCIRIARLNHSQWNGRAAPLPRRSRSPCSLTPPSARTTRCCSPTRTSAVAARAATAARRPARGMRATPTLPTPRRRRRPRRRRCCACRASAAVAAADLPPRPPRRRRCATQAGTKMTRCACVTTSRGAWRAVATTVNARRVRIAERTAVRRRASFAPACPAFVSCSFEPLRCCALVPAVCARHGLVRGGDAALARGGGIDGRARARAG